MSGDALQEVKKVGEALDQARSEMVEKLRQQEQELKQYGETTQQTAGEIKRVEEKIDTCAQDAKAHEERLVDLEKKFNRPGAFGGGDGGAPGQKYCTPGEQFVTSEVFERQANRGQPTGEQLEMRSLTSRELKDITSAGSSAGALIDEMRLPQIFRDPADRLNHVRDLLAVGQTSSNAIEYPVDFGGFVNNAASQANELDAKAQSELTTELKTEAVKTISHYMIASRQVLDDAPMLRSYIDGRLLYGLMLEEDDQLLNGDGSAGTLNGILQNPNIQDAGATGDLNTGDTQLDHLRRAIAMGRKANYPMNGLLVSPDDWAGLELQKGSDGHYIWVTVPQGGQPQLWRVPVVECNAMNEGEFIVGNWDLAAQLFDRQQSAVRVSDSHAQLFTQNGVAILAEERLALVIYRPQAFVKGKWPAFT